MSFNCYDCLRFSFQQNRGCSDSESGTNDFSGSESTGEDDESSDEDGDGNDEDGRTRGSLENFSFNVIYTIFNRSCSSVWLNYSRGFD